MIPLVKAVAGVRQTEPLALAIFFFVSVVSCLNVKVKHC